MAALLSTARLKVRKDQDYTPGMTESWVANVEGDGKAIVKPDSKKNTYVQYDTTHTEAVAYDVSEALGFANLCPPTVRREVGGRAVSVQAWSEDCEELSYWESDLDETSFKQAMVLDAVIGNIDRHGANLLVNRSTGKCVTIDNSAAFHPKLTIGTQRRLQEGPGAWYHAKKHWQKHFTGPFALSDKELGSVRRFLGNAQVRQSTVTRLGQDVWDGMVRRANQLLDHGTEEWW